MEPWNPTFSNLFNWSDSDPIDSPIFLDNSKEKEECKSASSIECPYSLENPLESIARLKEIKAQKEREYKIKHRNDSRIYRQTEKIRKEYLTLAQKRLYQLAKTLAPNLQNLVGKSIILEKPPKNPIKKMDRNKFTTLDASKLDDPIINWFEETIKLACKMKKNGKSNVTNKKSIKYKKI